MTDTMQDMLWCEACDTDHDASEMVAAVFKAAQYTSREDALARFNDRHQYYKDLTARENPDPDWIERVQDWVQLVQDFQNLLDEGGQRLERELLRYAQFVYFKEERQVCEDSTNSCDFCGERYIKYPVLKSLLGEQTVLGGVRVEYWSHHDRLCFDCSEEAFECDCCGDLQSGEEMYYVETADYRLCHSCHETKTVHCESCDETFMADRHDPVECGREGIINDYSYRPAPDFRHAVAETVTSRTPYIGIELEVECTQNYRYDDAEYAIGVLGDRAYLKHDGSLDDGFEIVTHPHTLAAYQTEFPFRVLQELSARGVRSWNTSTCGLHVHISRSAFNGLTHQAMFTILIQGNPDQMQRLAGRHSENWAKYGGESDYRTGKPLTAAKKVKPDHAHDRYQAVNTMNRATIEVRIFRGSLKRERVLSAIELVHAVFTYTAGLTSNDAINGALTFDAFRAWLNGRDQYANLMLHVTKYSL